MDRQEHNRPATPSVSLSDAHESLQHASWQTVSTSTKTRFICFSFNVLLTVNSISTCSPLLPAGPEDPLDPGAPYGPLVPPSPRGPLGPGSPRDPVFPKRRKQSEWSISRNLFSSPVVLHGLNATVTTRYLLGQEAHLCRFPPEDLSRKQRWAVQVKDLGWNHLEKRLCKTHSGKLSNVFLSHGTIRCIF